MGYMLSSVGNLPLDENIDLYIFVVNGQWLGEPYETIDRNFSKLAKRIGERAVIVKGLESQAWTADVQRAYLGDRPEVLLAMIPALLITDDHTTRLTADSLHLVVPLRDIGDRFLDWDESFRLLTNLATNADQEFLTSFEDNSYIEAAKSISDVKPNSFGIGLNLNAAWTRWFG